ncbi:MAG: tRNA guanosine(15) transglycosylase TgtA [Candidatus Bathyarchaeia archaeon]
MSGLLERDIFEVTDEDLLGRVGRLHTKSGILETPCIFPVVHPTNQPVSPKEMWGIGFKAVMTNAYLTRRIFGPDFGGSIHRLLDFPGVVATDSGAYQILVHGGIEANQEEIIEFEERIDSDIAVILDVPTGLTLSRRHAEKTVNETLERADRALRMFRRSGILWVGPVQGGLHLDLVSRCAREMANRGFPIIALGSPTQIMEKYMYRELVRMILACKSSIEPKTPLHLFGAGHPSMLALAVSLGCDLFDSASYAIYARNNRYMTPTGTARLDELQYLPCSCDVCRNHCVRDLLDLPDEERSRRLSLHNLNTLIDEINRIKQSIVEGRLWEHLGQRVRTHPKLFESILQLRDYSDMFERHTPISKRRGLFYFDHLDLLRPEVVRFRKRVDMEYSPPERSRFLLLLPPPPSRPYSSSRFMKRLLEAAATRGLDICFYMIPYGVVPFELSDIYPVAQTETHGQIDNISISETAWTISQYLVNHRYERVIVYVPNEPWARKVSLKVKGTCSRLRQGLTIHRCRGDPWRDEALEKLMRILEADLDQPHPNNTSHSYLESSTPSI